MLLPFLCPNVYVCTRRLQSSSCFIRHRLHRQVLHGVHRHFTARRSHYRAGPQSEGFIANVERRVQISLDLLSADWTSPHPLTELQVLLVATAAVMQLAGWIEATDHLHPSTQPLGFVA